MGAAGRRGGDGGGESLSLRKSSGLQTGLLKVLPGSPKEGGLGKGAAGMGTLPHFLAVAYTEFLPKLGGDLLLF